MVKDLIVVVPGIMGSSLSDADGREVWGLGGGTVLRALGTLAGSLRELTLPPGYEEQPAADGVKPTGLMPAFHVIPGLWTPIEG